MTQHMSYMPPHHILFHQLEQYMFTPQTIERCRPQEPPLLRLVPMVPVPMVPVPMVPVPMVPVAAAVTLPVAETAEKTMQLTIRPPNSRPSKQMKLGQQPLLFLTPRYKDKLFWCFYIICEGEMQYELVGANWFATEKDYKYQTAERLQSVKETIKTLKLRKSELETDLITEEKIGLNGLYALCLLHDTAITIVMGRKYIYIRPSPQSEKKNGIIVVNQHGEYTLRKDLDGSFLRDVYDNYWQVEGTKPGLKSIATYTLVQLQDICRRLLLPVRHLDGKAKTKPLLYQDILSKIE